MNRQYAWSLLAFAALSACDPAVTVHLVRRDRKPLVCPDNQEMTYTVHIQYRDGETYEEAFAVDGEPDHPTIGMLPGAIDRTVAWIRFEIYCGDSKKPVHVTPRIPLPEGLERTDDWNYTYYLDWKAPR